MVCESCAFESDRLSVGEWHSLVRPALPEQDLAHFITSVMTEPVTRSLPSAWQGEYTVDRARDWISERDSEGTTLLVLERSTGRPLGLVILVEWAAESDAGGVDVRIGYLLAESAWGQGLASELIEGLVRWCRAQASIQSLAGGVERDNLASARVLEKNGFRLARSNEPNTGELLFELRLTQRH